MAVRDCAMILTVFHEQWLRNLRNVIVAWKISWDRTQFFSFRNLYITVENLKMITSAKLRSKKGCWNLNSFHSKARNECIQQWTLIIPYSPSATPLCFSLTFAYEIKIFLYLGLHGWHVFLPKKAPFEWRVDHKH